MHENVPPDFHTENISLPLMIEPCSCFLTINIQNFDDNPVPFHVTICFSITHTLRARFTIDWRFRLSWKVVDYGLITLNKLFIKLIHLSWILTQEPEDFSSSFQIV